MRRAPLLAIAMLMLTAGCGGSDDPDGKGADPTTTPAPTETTQTTATTTAPTTTPAPAPTKSTSNSTLIDYGDDEVIVATPADVAKLTGAPADFKAFIAADLQRQQDSETGACTPTTARQPCRASRATRRSPSRCPSLDGPPRSQRWHRLTTRSCQSGLARWRHEPDDPHRAGGRAPHRGATS